MIPVFRFFEVSNMGFTSSGGRFLYGLYKAKGIKWCNELPKLPKL
jgi:hypothetical protein